MRLFGRKEAPEVPLFVVERFFPGMTPEGLEALAREQQGLDTVSYRHSTYVPVDETCFCLVEAGSAHAVKEANAVAGLPFERVVEAVHGSGGAPGVTGYGAIPSDAAASAADITRAPLSSQEERITGSTDNHRRLS